MDGFGAEDFGAPLLGCMDPVRAADLRRGVPAGGSPLRKGSGPIPPPVVCSGSISGVVVALVPPALPLELCRRPRLLLAVQQEGRALPRHELPPRQLQGAARNRASPSWLISRVSALMALTRSSAARSLSSLAFGPGSANQLIANVVDALLIGQLAARPGLRDWRAAAFPLRRGATLRSRRL